MGVIVDQYLLLGPGRKRGLSCGAGGEVDHQGLLLQAEEEVLLGGVGVGVALDRYPSTN